MSEIDALREWPPIDLGILCDPDERSAWAGAEGSAWAGL